MKWTSSFLAFLLVVPIAAYAATPKVSSHDHKWLVAAHQDNLAEIKSGDLAAERGHTDAVRDAGHMLAEDHGKLDAKLKQTAQQLDVELPQEPNAHQKREAREFQKLSGAKFDATWTRDEIKGHEKAIRMTEREIKDGSNPQVKELAQSALPVLQKHLRTLREASGSDQAAGTSR